MSEDIDEAQLETEEVDTSLVPMANEDFVAPGFRATVETVKVVKQFPVIDGNVDKSGEKSLYTICELSDQKYPWRWRVTNSTQGTHHQVQEAFKAIKVYDHNDEDTGDVGIALNDIKDLKGNEFYFERRNLKLGSFIKKNFPIPAIYYRPEQKEEEKKEENTEEKKEEAEEKKEEETTGEEE